MKPTRSGTKWVHVSCALWIPEVGVVLNSSLAQELLAFGSGWGVVGSHSKGGVLVADEEKDTF